MQSISPVTYADLEGAVQTTLQKFEILDGSTWVDLSARPPTYGLVGYWAFDESAGSVAADQSPYHAAGVLHNMDAADWVAGRFGNALDFDGDNDYVEVDDAAHLDITAAITVAAWVKPSSNPSWAVVLTKGTSSSWNTNNYVLGLQSGRVDFRWSSVGTCLVDVGDALVAGAWSHVCVTVAPGTTNAVNAYINGVLKKTANRSGDPTPNSTALRIGTDNGTDDFIGLIDEVRIYNRALTVAEVESLAGPVQKSYLKSLSLQLGGAGVSPAPVAGQWSAEIFNEDGIFHPRHPTSPYAGYLRVGRKVRISFGASYGNVDYFWQRLIGYMDAPSFDSNAGSVQLSGVDYCKPLTDTFLHSPDNYWGTSATFDSVAGPGGTGTELYAEADACDITGDANNVTNWSSPTGDVESATPGQPGGGSYYLAFFRDAAGPTEEYFQNTNVATMAAGHAYRIGFWARFAYASDYAYGYMQAYQSNDAKIGQATVPKTSAWTYYSFTATCSVAGALRLRFVSKEADAWPEEEIDLDGISVQLFDESTWMRYDLPAACNGPYFATLDQGAGAVPIWQGPEEDPSPGKEITPAWHYDEATKSLYFSKGMVISVGTNNLVIYYYTDTIAEDAVARLLFGAGLYGSEALAKAAMNYSATGVTIPRVWFESGTSRLEAIRFICERCNYRFWFSTAGVPTFLPAPTLGDPIVSFELKDASSANDFQDLEEIRNSVIIEGIDQAMYSMESSVGSSRLKGVASDATSITTYLEHTYSATNHLFQTQASVDAMAAAILAAYKDPKWYATLEIPHNPIPLDLGDSIGWEYSLGPAMTVRAKGLVRDVSLSETGFAYKVEMESGKMNILNYTTTPVTVTTEMCKGWVLTNAGAGADVHFDLPAAVVGMQITFYVMAAQTLTIDPNGTERIAVITGTNGDYLRSDNVIGSWITLACLVAGSWHKIGGAGTWTEE